MSCRHITSHHITSHIYLPLLLSCVRYSTLTKKKKKRHHQQQHHHHHHVYFFFATNTEYKRNREGEREKEKEREYRTNCADDTTIRGCFCDERNDIALLFPLPLPPTQHKTQHNTTQHRTERKKNDTATTTTTPPFRQYQQLYVTTI